MPVLAHPFPTTNMIRVTFELMLREAGHRGTAMRLTCRDLGVPPDTVLDAIGVRHPDPPQPRPH
jgi:hypothetical protein